MSRAIVLIGVSKTARDAFPTLGGVEDAIGKMEAWASSQCIPHIRKLVDVGNDSVPEVTISSITSTIERLATEAGSLEQLIVYFSGHGIVNSYNEYLLLSLAPFNANEAINVTGSIALAQTWKIPHVVFFSDACRSIATHFQVDRITGGLIIPNEVIPGPEKDVDIFYATRPGAPALEVAADGKKYIAVYTEVLQKGLSGRVPKLIKNGYIRPRPLKSWLAEAVPEHLLDMNLGVLVSQSPEARLGSGDEQWLSKFEHPVMPRSSDFGSLPRPDATTRPSEAGDGSLDSLLDGLDLRTARRDIPVQTAEAASILIDNALEEGPSRSRAERPPSAAAIARTTGRTLSRGAELLFQSTYDLAQQPTWVGERPRSGFLVVGSGVSRALSVGQQVRIDESQFGATVAMDLDSSASEVLIEFDSGRGTLLPVLRNYVGVVKVDKGRIAEVYYEPAQMDSSIERQQPSIQRLRSTVYKISSFGALNLDIGRAYRLARRLQSEKYLDPALAVYAAHAYQAIGRIEIIREMRDFLVHRLGIRLFDVELLSRPSSWEHSLNLPPLAPSTPLLSQGWALIDALLPTFPREISLLRHHVGQALWSDYDAEGVTILQAWMNSRSASQASLAGSEGDV